MLFLKGSGRAGTSRKFAVRRSSATGPGPTATGPCHQMLLGAAQPAEQYWPGSQLKSQSATMFDVQGSVSAGACPYGSPVCGPHGNLTASCRCNSFLRCTRRNMSVRCQQHHLCNSSGSQISTTSRIVTLRFDCPPVSAAAGAMLDGRQTAARAWRASCHVIRPQLPPVHPATVPQVCSAVRPSLFDVCAAGHQPACHEHK